MRATRMLIRPRTTRTTVTALATSFAGTAAVLLLLVLTPLGERLEAWTVDARIDRGETIERPDDAVIVEIDPSSLVKGPPFWPAPLSQWSSVITAIGSADSHLTVIDHPLLERMNSDDVALSSFLAQSKRYGNIIVGNRTVDGTTNSAAAPALTGLRSDEVTEPAKQGDIAVGMSTVSVDDDGTVRYLARTPAVKGPRDLSLPTLVAARAAGIDSGDLPLPAHVYLRPVRNIGELPRDGFNIVSGGSTTTNLRDKIVYIGVTGGPQLDEVPTSFNGTIPHVEYTVVAVENIHSGKWVLPVSMTVAVSLAVLLAIGVTLILIALPIPLGIFAWTSGAISYLVVAQIAVNDGLALPVAIPMTANVTAMTLTMLALGYAATRDRLRIKALFARYVSPEVVNNLVESDDTIELGGVEREITVLFSDIRGFTSLSEHASPREMVAQLNDFFGEMVDVITSENGTLDKFLGDGLMAIFGAPGSPEDHATNACRAALRMCERLEQINAQRRSDGLAELNIGIGIHTGTAVVGNIGSPVFRVDFTAIGDTVNLASRLETATKDLDAPIIVSSATRDACAHDFTFVERGTIVVKGRMQAVQVFELAAQAPALAAAGAPMA